MHRLPRGGERARGRALRRQRARTRIDGHQGSVRSQTTNSAGQSVPHDRLVDTAAISAISDRQRVRKSCRLSTRGTVPPGRWRTRKYCRSASNAVQNRAADAKLPKPSMGSSRCLMARWLCSARLFKYWLHRCRTFLPRIQRIALRYGGCWSVVTRCGLRWATSTRRRRKRRGGVLIAVLAEHGVEEVAIAVDGAIERAPAARDLHGGLIDGPGDAGAASALGPEPVRPERREAELPTPDRLVGDPEASLEEQRGDVAEAARGTETPEYGEQDDIRRVLEIVERGAGPLVEGPPAGAARGRCGSRARCAAAAGWSLRSHSGDSPQAVLSRSLVSATLTEDPWSEI